MHSGSRRPSRGLPSRQGSEKAILERLLGLLWQGHVSDAVTFVAGISPRTKKAPADLLGYLQKYAEEIIDYGRRQKAGKSLGSGRMEKAVEQVIGLRQKNRGMSGSMAGSHGDSTARL